MAGKMNDLQMAMLGLVDMLEEGERVFSDKGYRKAKYFAYPNNRRPDNLIIKKIQGRHENVNSRLREYGVMRNKFRQKLSFHNKCFNAVVNIVQLRICNGNPLPSISFRNYRRNTNT